MNIKQFFKSYFILIYVAVLFYVFYTNKEFIDMYLFMCRYVCMGLHVWV